jgi:hypothetical protein
MGNELMPSKFWLEAGRLNDGNAVHKLGVRKHVPGIRTELNRIEVFHFMAG